MADTRSVSSHAVSESFRKRADSACFWEAWVGSVLSRAGLLTVHQPFTLAEDAGRAYSDYAGTWDLEVGNCSDIAYLPVEVKSLNLTFSTAKDYPFPDVIVCSKHSHTRKMSGLITGRDFLFVSRETGSIVWLPRGTMLFVATVTDKSRNETYEVVKTPKTSLRELSDFTEAVRGV